MNKKLKSKLLFLGSKWIFRILSAILLVYCFIIFVLSFFNENQEKVIKILNILFLIGVSLSVHYLYVKMVLVTYGLAAIGLMIHSVLNESLFSLLITLFFIISGSEFIIVATIYKEKRLKELWDQRYSAATIY